MQERDGGGFLCHLNPVRAAAAASLPCKGESGGFLEGLGPVHAVVTPPTYNSEPDGGFYGPSALFAPLLPPRMLEVVCMDFRPVRAAAVSLACNSNQVLEW